MNRKGHLTNLKREFMWEIFKMIFNTKLQCMREKCYEEKEIHQTSSAIPCAYYKKRVIFENDHIKT